MKKYQTEFKPTAAMSLRRRVTGELASHWCFLTGPHHHKADNIVIGLS